MSLPALVQTRLFAMGRIELWGRRLRCADLPPPGLPASVTFGRITADTPDSAAQRHRLAEAMRPCPPVEIERRLAGGRRAYVLGAGGGIVAYGWVSLTDERISEVEGTIHVGPGDAYIWDCATLPAWRGRGLYPALLRAVAVELAAEGLGWVWIAAKADNTPSLRGIIKAGYLRIARVRYVRLLSWRRYLIAGCPSAPVDRLVSARRAFA